MWIAVVGTTWHSEQAIGLRNSFGATCAWWAPAAAPFVPVRRPFTSSGGAAHCWLTVPSSNAYPAIVMAFLSPWQKEQLCCQFAQPAAAWQALQDGAMDCPA